MARRSDSIPNRHKGRKINPTTTNTKWIKSEKAIVNMKREKGERGFGWAPPARH
jgi:hypothetical protein